MTKETKKPENTAFKQQRLKSWQPLLTPKSVIPSFFVIGLLFIPLGCVLYLASQNVTEVSFDYTLCDKEATETYSEPKVANGIKLWKYDQTSKVCSVQFDIERQLSAPVYLYYRLTNFYQNNRKYVKSFDLKQLKGEALSAKDLSLDCDPLRSVKSPEDVRVNGTVVKSDASAVYYPCGLIANSLFSDVIGNITCISSEGLCKPGENLISYAFGSSGIAWPMDSERYAPSKYKEIEGLTTKVLPPPFWRTAFPIYKDGYTAENFPNLHEDERFMVWMRTAGLPTFRKLYGVNYNSLLPPGTWEFNITLSFDVDKFGGTKSVVISETSVLGGKNNFLGGAYILVGALCIAFGTGFLVKNWSNPRKLGDHQLLSWNQSQRSGDQVD